MIIKPYLCTAIGCKERPADGKPFCEGHWKHIDVRRKADINKALVGVDLSSTDPLPKPLQAAVFRAQTKLGLKDRRISPDMRDRREYYAKTVYEGMTREQALAA